MPENVRRAELCRVVFLLTVVLFCGLAFAFRVTGFHLRPTTIGAGLVSNDIYVEITQARALAAGDLKAIHDARYGANLARYRNEGWSFDGVPATALLVLPIVSVGDRLGWEEVTIWGVAGLPFALCAPFAAWIVWRVGGGATGDAAPDVTLVAAALLLSPLTFQTAIFEARPYYLTAALNVLAVVALPHSNARSAGWMALALIVKATSLVTAMCIGCVLLADVLRGRGVRPLLQWGGIVAGGVTLAYAPFLVVNGARVLENLRSYGKILPVTPGSLPWGLLRVFGATRMTAPLHVQVQDMWTSVLLAVCTAGCLWVVIRTRITRTSSALLALVAGAHAFVVAASKVVQFRYGVLPAVLAVAWAVQPGVSSGWRWAIAMLVAQTFVLTAVPIEWKVSAWCVFHAVVAVVALTMVWRESRPSAKPTRE